MVASSVLANDGLEKHTPDLCHEPPHLEIVPLHPQNMIDFNHLTHQALASAESEKDKLKKEKTRKTCSVLFIFHYCSVFSTE